MKIFYGFLLFFTVMQFCFTQSYRDTENIHQVDTIDSTTKIKIPNEWIDKFCNYKNKEVIPDLIQEFIDIINPLEIKALNYEIEREYWFINNISIDLDSDSSNEILALMGKSERYPVLLVFKNIKNEWYLLFTEQYYMHYSKAELCLCRIFGTMKRKCICPAIIIMT